MDLASTIFPVLVAATLAVALGLAASAVLSGRPGWGLVVLYGAGTPVLVGLGWGAAGAAAVTRGMAAQVLLGPDVVALIVGALWIIYTAAAVLSAAGRRPARSAAAGRGGK